MTVVQLHPEHCVRQCFGDCAFELDGTVFLGHKSGCLLINCAGRPAQNMTSRTLGKADMGTALRKPRAESTCEGTIRPNREKRPPGPSPSGVDADGLWGLIRVLLRSLDGNQLRDRLACSVNRGHLDLDGAVAWPADDVEDTIRLDQLPGGELLRGSEGVLDLVARDS